jgi:hypothetical protein
MGRERAGNGPPLHARSNVDSLAIWKRIGSSLWALQAVID